MPRNKPAPLKPAPRAPSIPAYVWLICLLAAFAAYAAVFISETSFTIHGVRYFVLQDDGMISMRYAHNLATGHGLVWNPGGARVEGFTNLLWVLVMAAIHRLPIPLADMALPVQILAAVLVGATGVCAYLLTAELTQDANGDEPGSGSRLAAMTAAAFTLFYYPFVNWSLQGSEVCAMALVVTASALIAVRSMRTGRGYIALYALLTAGELLRADGFVLGLAFIAALTAADPPHRKANLAVGLPILLGTAAALTLWRQHYYGWPLPNTYYLKMTGYPALPRIEHGLIAFGEFLKGSWFAPLIAAIAGIPLLRNRRIAPIAAVIAVQSAYSIYVGGDAWEWYGGANRYLCIVAPLFFVTAVLAARYHICSMTERSLLPAIMKWPVARARMAVIAAVAAGFIAMDAAARIPAQAILASPPPEIDSNRRNVEYALAVKSLTLPNQRVAVVWAGTTPYFCGRECIDLLGKCDAHVAHTAMHLPEHGSLAAGFWPGHLKWDYAYSIGKLQPDIVVDVNLLHRDADPYMQPYGIAMDGDMTIAIRHRAVSGNPLP